MLRRGLESGILEQDYTVVAYCPSCQTSLSHAEVNQGYEEIEDPSLYYKVRLAGRDEYLVVWTTMPFTLVTDAMIGLDPDETYCRVRVGSEKWIVGSARLGPLMEELGLGYEVESSAPGSSFEGLKYEHPLLDVLPRLAELARGPNHHVAVCEKFVDAGAGSGLVHLSPANGEEDMAAASRRGVEVFCPIDDEARFTRDAGPYAGMQVREADAAVARDLEARGALVRLGRLRHKYPLCWRSRHPVVWLARRGWFYKLDRLGDAAVKAAESVQYYYEQPRNRFLSIVRERHPWCISRERAWGTPLPAWKCSRCGKHTWLFSREQIVRAADELPDGPRFELHVPWIDRVAVRCSSCGGPTKREGYVLDTWHNSGSAPLASLTDQEYASQIPAPFFTEGIDQTRGWAYTLLVESVIYRGEPAAPYRSFLFQGHVLDEKGNKMSKSRGNVLDARRLLSEHPADLVRFYMMWKTGPIEPLNFDAREMSARPYQVLATLYHMHLYYVQNGSYDKYDGAATVEWAEAEGLLREPDRWLLSRLSGTVRECGEAAGACRFHEWARSVEDFVINALSQAYVPMTRAELWDDGEGGAARRRAIYAVMQKALTDLDVVLHPICPHTTEYLYAQASGARPSVLLEGWPEPGARDERLESAFELVRECVSAASAARMKAGLKRRWPVDSLDVCLPRAGARLLEGLEGLIAEQANADRCAVHPLESDGGAARVAEICGLGLGRPSASVDRKRLGPRARGSMQALMAEHERTDPSAILKDVLESGSHRYEAGGLELGEADYEFSVEAREGSALAERGGIAAAVPSSRSPGAAARGLVRDVARRIQAFRKECGYDPAEVLSCACVLGLEGDVRRGGALHVIRACVPGARALRADRRRARQVQGRKDRRGAGPDMPVEVSPAPGCGGLAGPRPRTAESERQIRRSEGARPQAASSGMPRLISAECVPLGGGCWPLVRDPRRRRARRCHKAANIKDRATGKTSVRADSKFAHVSRNTPMPGDATVIFAKTRRAARQKSVTNAGNQEFGGLRVRAGQRLDASGNEYRAPTTSVKTGGRLVDLAPGRFATLDAAPPAPGASGHGIQGSALAGCCPPGPALSCRRYRSLPTADSKMSPALLTATLLAPADRVRAAASRPRPVPLGGGCRTNPGLRGPQNDRLLYPLGEGRPKQHMSAPSKSPTDSLSPTAVRGGGASESLEPV